MIIRLPLISSQIPTRCLMQKGNAGKKAKRQTNFENLEGIELVIKH